VTMRFLECVVKLAFAECSSGVFEFGSHGKCESDNDR